MSYESERAANAKRISEATSEQARLKAARRAEDDARRTDGVTVPSDAASRVRDLLEGFYRNGCDRDNAVDALTDIMHECGGVCACGCGAVLDFERMAQTARMHVEAEADEVIGGA